MLESIRRRSIDNIRVLPKISKIGRFFIFELRPYNLTCSVNPRQVCWTQSLGELCSIEIVARPNDPGLAAKGIRKSKYDLNTGREPLLGLKQNPGHRNIVNRHVGDICPNFDAHGSETNAKSIVATIIAGLVTEKMSRHCHMLSATQSFQGCSVDSGSLRRRKS